METITINVVSKFLLVLDYAVALRFCVLFPFRSACEGGHRGEDPAFTIFEVTA
jgi:hypothetical protein